MVVDIRRDSFEMLGFCRHRLEALVREVCQGDRDVSEEKTAVLRGLEENPARGTLPGA